ncbi:MAG: sigma-54-dependent Fis family transcriptional regulator [Deltaproteobacteria bacterium]|nr:sigma-54-dependent Fis family transcriptional regulator [Deltaproteobacteria bacterium]MBW2414350.1 sigma-54-dependent Fis family transcriptional regulator [Deltaproteobacteria bacterium]
MSEQRTVLIVEDEANMRRILGALLRRAGYRVLEARDGGEALTVLDDDTVHAVVSDLKMPRMNGLELLEAIRSVRSALPVILLTAHGTIGSAVEALKQGAFDYLTKPFDPDEVQQVVEKAVRTSELQQSEASLNADEDPEKLLLGASRALLDVKRMVERVAPTSATVLLSGESGTGKELVAQSLHRQSDRSEQPFVKINCAAIPESLLESELFGHEKGAFTGATRRKPGRFELADGGTLFLDEIGEMPLSAQPKLLRAIQDGRFYRVGGTRTIDVDVRLIAATNRDLEQNVREGLFREDLYYRLKVVPIHLPALRDRREDIGALAQFFVERFARRLSRTALGVDPEALATLRAHDWPGNIRELENVIERAVLLSDGPTITLCDLPEGLEAAPAEPAPLREQVRSATRDLERRAIVDALDATGNNVTRAAERLGLSRRGLQLKMRELDIRRDPGSQD